MENRTVLSAALGAIVGMTVAASSVLFAQVLVAGSSYDLRDLIEAAPGTFQYQQDQRQFFRPQYLDESPVSVPRGDFHYAPPYLLISGSPLFNVGDLGVHASAPRAIIDLEGRSARGLFRRIPRDHSLQHSVLLNDGVPAVVEAFEGYETYRNLPGR